MMNPIPLNSRMYVYHQRMSSFMSMEMVSLWCCSERVFRPERSLLIKHLEWRTHRATQSNLPVRDWRHLFVQVVFFNHVKSKSLSSANLCGGTDFFSSTKHQDIPSQWRGERPWRLLLQAQVPPAGIPSSGRIPELVLHPHNLPDHRCSSES